MTINSICIFSTFFVSIILLVINSVSLYYNVKTFRDMDLICGISTYQEVETYQEVDTNTNSHFEIENLGDDLERILELIKPTNNNKFPEHISKILNIVNTKTKQIQILLGDDLSLPPSLYKNELNIILKFVLLAIEKINEPKHNLEELRILIEEKMSDTVKNVNS